MRATVFAEGVHTNQRRADGSAYVGHLYRVALFASTLHGRVKEQSVAFKVGLLHDAIEDAGVTVTELTAAFGESVAQRVALLTLDDDTVPRPNRKTTKWSRVAAADYLTRYVHCADVLDNLIALRFLEKGDDAFAKIPRWLMQARDYQLPIARCTDEVVAALMQEEISAQVDRGILFGTWDDA